MPVILRETVEAQRQEAKKVLIERAANSLIEQRAIAAESEARRIGLEQSREQYQSLIAATFGRIMTEIENAVKSIEAELRRGTIMALKQILETMPPDELIASATAHAMTEMNLSRPAVLHVHPSLVEKLKGAAWDAAKPVAVEADALLRVEDAVLETALGRIQIGPLHQANLLANAIAR